jgi:hypothetical protein
LPGLAFHPLYAADGIFFINPTAPIPRRIRSLQTTTEQPASDSLQMEAPSPNGFQFDRNFPNPFNPTTVPEFGQ